MEIFTLLVIENFTNRNRELNWEPHYYTTEIFTLLVIENSTEIPTSVIENLTNEIPTLLLSKNLTSRNTTIIVIEKLTSEILTLLQ